MRSKMTEENKEFVRKFLNTMDAQDWDAFREVVSSQQKFAETPIIIDITN